MVALVSQETIVSLVTPENVVGNLVSRTGRHLQRYQKGRRQVVGLASVFSLFLPHNIIERLLV